MTAINELDRLCLETFEAHPLFKSMDKRDREAARAVFALGWDSALDLVGDALRAQDEAVRELTSMETSGTVPQ